MDKNTPPIKLHQNFSKAEKVCRKDLFKNALNLLDFKGYEVEQYSYSGNINSIACQAVIWQTYKIGTIQNV